MRGSWISATRGCCPSWRLGDESGATAVEYGVMVGLIAAVIVGAVLFLGQRTEHNFSRVGEACDAAGAPCP